MALDVVRANFSSFFSGSSLYYVCTPYNTSYKYSGPVPSWVTTIALSSRYRIIFSKGRMKSLRIIAVALYHLLES